MVQSSNKYFWKHECATFSTHIDHKRQTLYPKLFNLRRVLSMARFVNTRLIACFHLFFGKFHNLLYSIRFFVSFIKLLNMVTVAIAFAVAVTAVSAVNVARLTLSICIARPCRKGNATQPNEKQQRKLLALNNTYNTLNNTYTTYNIYTTYKPLQHIQQR